MAMETQTSQADTPQNLQREGMAQEKRISIAIDGPAGSGKSTLAKKVAETLGYLYIDTGAMYRAATWIALEQKVDLKDHARITQLLENASLELKVPDATSQGRVRVFVNGADVSFIIRSRIITRFVSPISAIAGVRKILVHKQQMLATNGGIVMDGRDIGTVVLPHAEVKIFLTASPEIRAARRLKDLKEMGQIADLDTIITDIKARDHFDSTREISPLKQAEDAILINTDQYDPDELAERVLILCREKAQAS